MSLPPIKRVTFDEAPPMVVELPLCMPPDLEIDPADTAYQDIVRRMTEVFYQIQPQETLKAITAPKRWALVTIIDGILADIGAKESPDSPIPLCWKVAKIVTCFLGMELCRKHDYKYPGKCAEVVIAEKRTMPQPKESSVWWGDISCRWCEFFVVKPSHRKRAPHAPF